MLKQIFELMFNSPTSARSEDRADINAVKRAVKVGHIKSMDIHDGTIIVMKSKPFYIQDSAGLSVLNLINNQDFSMGHT